MIDGDVGKAGAGFTFDDSQMGWLE